MSREIQNQIKKIIEEAAGSAGYTVYEAFVMGSGEKTRINVKIDNETVISHQDCQNYSQELTRLLDNADLLPNYTLEVSSPGLKRKIRTLKEFERFIGSQAKIVYNGESKTEVFKGTVAAVEGESITIKIDTREYIIMFQQIKSANLDY
jgi:ribosome maturation factor RimP